MDPIPARHTLSKKERLSDISGISHLMSEGQFGRVSGMKYCFRQGTGEPVNRILVSVPKRFFKRAVKRNLLKRRIRESYRLQKDILTVKGIDIMFLYNTNEMMDSATIFSIVGDMLSEISTKLS